MPPDAPEDPFAQMAAGAIDLYSLFNSYVLAGFTRAEALKIVTTIIATTIGGAVSG